MKGSIRAKLLAMCIILVLVITGSISATYYILTKQDKQRESQQRIQIALDIILEDMAQQGTESTQRFDEFLKQENMLYWTTYLYNQDTSQLHSVQFVASYLTSAATKLKDFGHLVAADHLRMYGANKRLLAAYRRYGEQETVGGYVIAETGNNAYLNLDNPSQVQTLLLLDHNPIPDAPLPNGIPASYEGEMPETISLETVNEQGQLGYRIVAPIHDNKGNKAGILVGEFFYKQTAIEGYASLSKTAVNVFAGEQFSSGTLPVQTRLLPDMLEQMVSCEDILARNSAIEIMPVLLETQEYYQGGCLFRTPLEMVGAITASFSKEIEEAEIRKILTVVFTIAGIGIAVCVGLISWIVVPTFTGPIITLTQAALKMAKGDLQQDINTSGTDELGTLAQSFVHMRDEIQKKQEALQQLNEELEQRVEERTAEITRQKYILDTFMENVPDSIYFKDRDSRIIRANKAYAARMGIIDPAEEIGKTDFDFFSEEFARMKYEQEQEIIRTGQPLLVLEEPDGNGRWSLTTKMPLRDEYGGVIGTFGISHDITRLKHTEEALKQAKEAADEARKVAEAANQAKSEFLANMSHELRTPLNVILGFAQMMTRNPHIPEEERENLEIIRRSGEHLLTLINNVLDMSKIEAERNVFQKSTIDLFRLLDELEEMFSLKTSQKQIALTFEHAADVPRYISTDGVKLRQVLMNLLNNAVKFTEEGGVTVRIENCQLNIENCQETASDPQYSIVNIQFSIEDTGPGIAPDELSTLFEAFRQTYTGRESREGTGLGLAISQKFVQVMGGEITVQSHVGRGTTFTFAVPVEVVEATDVAATPERRRVIALEPGQPRYRILIVDDRPDSRRLLVKLLTPLEFEVREAANGQEAIAAWNTFAPHLIWMDLQMPVVDGYDATKRIRAVGSRQSAEGRRQYPAPSTQHPAPSTQYPAPSTQYPAPSTQHPVSSTQHPVPSTQYPAPSTQHPTPSPQHPVIIALTAGSFEDEQAIALTTEFDDLLRKPFRETDIFTLLHKHLGVRYVYEEVRPHPGKRENEHIERTLAQMATLPTDLFAELQKAVNAAEPRLVQRVIVRIREHNSALAGALTELVEQFRFDLLQALVEESM